MVTTDKIFDLGINKRKYPLKCTRSNKIGTKNKDQNKMYISILVLPLKGSLIAPNRKCGSWGGPKLSLFCISLATIKSLIAFKEVFLKDSTVTINLGNWFKKGNKNKNFEFTFDS